MTMPAGRYYIGDLVYVMHDVWDEVINLLYPNEDDNMKEGEFILQDGRKFVAFSTAWGDGVYDTNTGHLLSVDAGLIGCILIDDIRDEEGKDSVNNLGAVIDFPKPFEVSGMEKWQVRNSWGRMDRTNKDVWDGIIYLGHVEVYTNPGEVDDEDYYDDE